jgi:hypothetical protein
MPTAGDERERSPHPYARRGRRAGRPEESSNYQTPTNLSSESGTEADDERPSQYLKALLPPSARPAKGLRQADGTPSPLLTPSQLDNHGHRLSEGYFDHKPTQTPTEQAEEDELLVARRLYEKRTRAERIRRISEGALLAAIGLIIVLAPSVTHALWNWHRGLFAGYGSVSRSLMPCSRGHLSISRRWPPDCCIPPENRHLLSFRRHKPSTMAPLPSPSLFRSRLDYLSHLCSRLNRPFFAASVSGSPVA